ncbi:MAG TPA: Gldg family protein [Vicinamibacterales bacterium]|nr:Gldg family protein [Vicinamibacterales bacterium]
MKQVLSALSWVGVALVMGAVAVQWKYPDYNTYARYAAFAGLILVLVYVASQWREIAGQFKKRNTRLGTIASASVIIVLGILIAVNYLSTRRNKRWDLTENKQYSLSEQSVKLLQGISSPVKFIVFDQEPNFDRYRTRLTEYAYNSRQVQVEYVDPDKVPVKAKEYKIESYGTIVVDYMGRTERVTNNTEQDLTNALIKVINPQTKKVYFLSGHGEKDTGSSERAGYSGIVDALKRDNYQFDKLVLAQTNEIPKDATVLVIAGPRTDLLEQEVPIIDEYLNSRTGKLFVMIDPPDDFKQPQQMPRLTALLKEWGINATQSVVVDVSGRTQVATVPVAAPPYPSHAITNDFSLITMFPLTRAVLPETGAEKRAGQSFVQTAARSWAETDFKELAAATSGGNPSVLKPETDKGDIAGPVSIAVATEVASNATPPDAPKDAKNAKPDEKTPKPETRVAAIGNSAFATNSYLGVEGNRDLFMNTVNWLAQQESLISIRPRDASDRRLTLTANIRDAMFYLSIFVIPAVVLGTGVMTWWRRR